MKCVAVTPEGVRVDQEVKFVVAPLYDGEYGIGKDHAPVVGRLGAGEARLTLEDGSIERWYLEGGFVEVAGNVVSILTDSAYELKSLDLDAARKELDEAVAWECSPILAEDKARVVERARAKVRAAEKAAKL